MKNKIISILIIFTTLVGVLNVSFATTTKDETKKNVIERTANNNENEEKMQTEKQSVKTNNEVKVASIENEENEVIILEITNKDKETKSPISGNIFAILNEDLTYYQRNLATNNEGKINIEIEKVEGKKYFIKQISVVSNYKLNLGLIELKSDELDNVSVNIENEKIKTAEEITNTSQEINYIEDTKNINENNIKDIKNIEVTNINKEKVNTTNETNWNNTNYFTNNINKKDTLNLTKETYYDNIQKEESYEREENRVLDTERLSLKMSRGDYINLVDLMMSKSAKVPVLPQGSK